MNTLPSGSLSSTQTALRSGQRVSGQGTARFQSLTVEAFLTLVEDLVFLLVRNPRPVVCYTNPNHLLVSRRRNGDFGKLLVVVNDSVVQQIPEHRLCISSASTATSGSDPSVETTARSWFSRTYSIWASRTGRRFTGVGSVSELSIASVISPAVWVIPTASRPALRTCRRYSSPSSST